MRDAILESGTSVLARGVQRYAKVSSYVHVVARIFGVRDRFRGHV